MIAKRVEARPSVSGKQKGEEEDTSMKMPECWSRGSVLHIEQLVVRRKAPEQGSSLDE